MAGYGVKLWMFSPACRCDGAAAIRDCRWLGWYKKAVSALLTAKWHVMKTGPCDCWFLQSSSCLSFGIVRSRQNCPSLHAFHRAAALYQHRDSSIHNTQPHTTYTEPIPGIIAIASCCGGTTKQNQRDQTIISNRRVTWATQLPRPKPGTVRVGAGSRLCHRHRLFLICSCS